MAVSSQDTDMSRKLTSTRSCFYSIALKHAARWPSIDSRGPRYLRSINPSLLTLPEADSSAEDLRIILFLVVIVVVAVAVAVVAVDILWKGAKSEKCSVGDEQRCFSPSSLSPSPSHSHTHTRKTKVDGFVCFGVLVIERSNCHCLGERAPTIAHS